MFEIDASAGLMPGTTGQLDADTSGGAGGYGVTLGTGTGQQGHAPVDTSTSNPFVAVWDWLNAPFTMPLSPWTTGLLVGVILIAVIAWNMVLYHIRIAAEAI
jgi:hypothetical protein